MFDEFGYKEARTGCVQIQQTGGGLGLGLFQDTSAADSRCALRVSVVPEATARTSPSSATARLLSKTHGAPRRCRRKCNGVRSRELRKSRDHCSECRTLCSLEISSNEVRSCCEFSCKKIYLAGVLGRFASASLWPSLAVLQALMAKITRYVEAEVWRRRACEQSGSERACMSQICPDFGRFAGARTSRARAMSPGWRTSGTLSRE